MEAVELHEKLFQAETRILQLEMRVLQLEEALGQRHSDLSSFQRLGLSPRPAQILGIILTAQEIATKQSIFTIMDDGEREYADPEHLLRQQIYAIRRKLRPFKIDVTNIHGAGYKIDPDGKQRLGAVIRALS